MDGYIFLTILTKFILYLACFFAIGTVFYRYCFQPKQSAINLAFGAQSIKLFVSLFALIGLVASILSFLIKLLSLSNSFAGLFDTELISLLWNTSTGDAFILRIIGFSVILLCCKFWWDKADQISLILLLCASVLILKSFSSIGHIHSLNSFFSQLLSMLHLLGLCLWIGVLIPLYQFTRKPKFMQQAQQCAEIFGYWAIRFVPVLLGAGIWLAYQLLGSWNALFKSQFGQILLIKLIVVYLLLIIAALNKFYYVAKMRAEQPNTIRNFHRSIKLELVLVGIIFYCSAMLTSVTSLPQ